MNAVRNFSTEGDYKVADISLAEWGRKEIELELAYQRKLDPDDATPDTQQH